MSEELTQAVDQVESRAGRLGLALSAAQLSLFARFLVDLEEYNGHTNLVATADPGSVAVEHIVDSLTLAQFILPRVLGQTSPSLVDIGSGAGFPGLVLAVAIPELKVSLVESVEKKARFLSEEVRMLPLPNVEVINARAESIAHQMRFRKQFDFATARALAPLDITSELAIPFLNKDGLMLLQKSCAQVGVEMERAARALPKLAARVRGVHVFDRALLGKDHAVIIVERTGDIPEGYPRSWNRIKKDPLSG